MKTIILNLLITGFLLFIFMLSPPIVYPIWKKVTAETVNQKSGLHIYKNFEWAEEHFREFRELNTVYHDFYTWRRADFSGKTININEGVRDSFQPHNMRDDIEVWFFGGSTTWGTGVSDNYTYPSLFAEQTLIPVKNFGESGFISSQSSAFLNELYLRHGKSKESRLIVFYDGANDVQYKCQRKNDGLSTSRELQIRKLIDPTTKFSFLNLFRQHIEFLSLIQSRLMPNLLGFINEASKAEQIYSCSEDSTKAIAVARSLVDTWKISKAIANSFGDEFVAVLHPVIFLGRPEADYLNISQTSNFAAQFKTVYPLIVELAAQEDINFVDLTSIYDGCDFCYIDFAHVGPDAHEILARELISKLKL